MAVLGIKELHEGLQAFLTKELPRLQKMEDYFSNEHDILKKPNRLETKEDTKLVHGYPSLIVTLATAYFLGKPISYIYENRESQDFKKLSEYLSTEEEQQENFEHSQNCSIFGKSYELWYKEVGGDIKNVVLDPRDVYILRDNTVQKNIIAAVRWDSRKNEKNETEYTLEAYDSKNKVTHTYIGTSKEIPNVEGIAVPHGFDRVPIIEFLNNKRGKGDFEGVISLIDGYNTTCSTSVDDTVDFTDAILVLKNFGGTTQEDMESVKRDRVMKTDDQGDAKWLIKDVNDNYSQNIKNRLNQDIHKFAMIPDMQDEKFAGNSSGVALNYKLLSLEQLASQKEMYFKKALNQRLQLMIDFHNLNLKPKQIQKVFTRNVPKNWVENAQVVTQLTGVVSQETLLSTIPFVEDARTEMKKLKLEQKENEIDDMNTPLKEVDVEDGTK